MYPFKRIMVCLDLSGSDASLMRFINIFCSRMVERILFFHVAPAAEIPEEIARKYPGLAAPTIESIRARIVEKIEKDFKPYFSCSFDIEISQGGSIAEHILKASHRNQADLLALGIKKAKASEELAGKIARLSHCSVAVVPDNIDFILKKIVVPVDFSYHSGLALEEAIEIASEKKAEVVCLHTFQVPAGYHTTGKSYEEFALIMKENAANEYKNFVEQIDLKSLTVKARFTLDKHHKPAKEICQFAVKQKASLLVIGSKGRTAAASMVFGSVAEKTLSQIRNIPVLVVKDKKENLGFLKAILKL